MRYGKLNDGNLSLAPNPILHDGLWVGNPPAEVYLAEGYKPVILNEQPEPLGVGWWVELWTEDKLNIYNVWEWHEATDDDEISDAEALGTIMGGDG